MRPPVTRLLVLTATALFLVACGNKTPLAPPPGAIITTEEGEEIEAPRPDRPFILDPLL